jgi:hypothetical protein
LPRAAAGLTRVAMAIELNRSAYNHAKRLIADEKAVLDERDDWSEHQPTPAQENAFISEHGWNEYAKWHLGVDDERSEQTKRRYRFPYGDFERVHRCGVLAAESRAGQYDHEDVKHAAAHLHGMLEQMRSAAQRR